MTPTPASIAQLEEHSKQPNADQIASVGIGLVGKVEGSIPSAGVSVSCADSLNAGGAA